MSIPDPTRASQRFAILIGINDYSAYDRSTGGAPGTMDLKGTLNDVLLMHRQCLRLGYDPKRVITCTHPRLDPETLGLPADSPNVMGATKAEIKRVFGLMGDRIGKKGGSLGLVYYAGHGATDADGSLVLCPSDTVLIDGKLANVIDTEDAEAQLPTGCEVVLDCCHSGAGRSLTPTAPKPRVDGRFRPRDALLAACAADQTSKERVFDGKWHGAFSFCLSLLLEQWEVDSAGGVSWLAVTHESLCMRADAMLAALSCNQNPIYSGPRNVVFGMVPGAEAHEPDASTIIAQIWSGDVGSYKSFQVKSGNTQIGWYVTLGSSCPTSSLPSGYQSTFSTGNEFWAWKSGYSPFPASFTLVPQTTWDNSMPTASSAWTKVPCQPLPISPTNAIPAGSYYQVTVTGLGGVYFYMKRTGSNPVSQTWYANFAATGSPTYIGNGSQTINFATVTNPAGSYATKTLVET